MNAGSRSQPEATSGPPSSPLSSRDRNLLLELARRSILHGLEAGEALPVDPETVGEALLRPGAAFVTLERRGCLRGCIGSYLARRSLVEDVVVNAFNAAFRDPRFPPLTSRELPELDLHISILSVPDPLEVESEEELLAALHPGVDGLLLEDPPYRSTFLPQVWRSLPEPADFLEHLKLKAGLSPEHWSPTLRFWRYTVEEIREGSRHD